MTFMTYRKERGGGGFVAFLAILFFSIVAAGFLTFSEFNTVLAQLGLKFTEARAFVWFDCGDEDGSGTMEFEEFRHLMAMVSRVSPPPFLTLRDVFALFAVDNAKEAAERTRPSISAPEKFLHTAAISSRSLMVPPIPFASSQRNLQMCRPDGQRQRKSSTQ
jgi:hypothetical protein